MRIDAGPACATRELRYVRALDTRATDCGSSYME